MSIKKPFLSLNKVDYHHPHLLLNVDAVAMEDCEPAKKRLLMIEFQKQIVEANTEEEGFVSDLDIVFDCVHQNIKDKLRIWIAGAEDTVSEYDVITKPLTEQIQRTAANLRKQKKENLEYQKLLKEKDREFNKLEQTNSHLVKKSRDLKAKIAKLEEELTTARSRNQETIERNRRDMEEKESKYDEQIKAIKNECIAHINRTKDECNSRVNHTKREYDARINHDKSEYDARIETYQARLASLSTALSESKEVAYSLNAKIAVLEEQLIEETNSKISFKRHSENLHIELADCKLQSAALEATIAKQEGNLKILWDKLSRLLEHNPDQRNILDNTVHFFKYSRSPIIKRGTDMVIPRELYVINSMIEIEAGAMLTIEAGTVMEFGENAGIVCNGNLIVNGTKGKPVVFRSNSETGSDRKWQNISVIGANSSCKMTHCVVDSGGGCKSAIHKGKKLVEEYYLWMQVKAF